MSTKTEVFHVSADAEKLLQESFRTIAPGEATHEELLNIVTNLPSDFEPYGKRERNGPDCSCGCNFYHSLEGKAGGDWGVCTNPKSPRVGLLTFEHAGCPEWTDDPRWEQVEKAELKILRADKRKQRGGEQ